MDNGNSELYDRSPHSKNSEEEGEEVGYEYDEKSFDDEEEEEEEEEDEEEARKVAEGFIVDDDEEQESDASQEVAVRRKKRKKVQDFDEELDEEDLDLLEENTGLKLSRSSAPKLKRLKRGRQEEEPTARAERAVDKFFSDEEEEAAAVEDQMEEDDDRYRGRGGYVQQYDDLNDFIAEEDEDERYEDERGMDYARPAAPRGRLTKDMMDILPQGLTEDAIADMYDIFGDGADYEWALYDEEGEEVEQERELQLADVFEPSELAERMLTDQDEDIRMMDVPERMQLRYSGIEKDFLTKPSTEEVENEAMWIARELTRIKPEYQLGDTFVSAVRSVVGFMTRNLLEVPFIYDQRKDYIVEIDPVTGVTNEILTYDDLWKIYDLDFRYDGLVRRKHLLREFMSKCFISDADIDQLLESAEKTEEVADLQDHITFQYAENVHRAQKQTKGPKRPTSKLNYESALKKRLQGFLERFSITARQLGMNYYENGRRYYPDDTLISPEEAANEYKDEHALTTPELVLKAAKSVLALEIANDPLVRKAMRRDWETRAVVTVKPTDKGYDIIDDLHPLHPYKFLYQKPIQTFRNGAFLHILKGESDGLLQISITIANYDGWFKQIAEFYMSDGYSDSAQQWNAQRKQVLEIAMNEHLRPLMEKHIREKLRQSAQEEICEGAYKNLLAKVDVGPFRGPGADTYKNGIPRVVTVSFGNGGRDDPVNGVCLNHRSRIIDKIQLPNLRDSSYIKDMTDFLTTTRPHVVGVAGYTAETRRLLKTMQQLVADINNDSSYEGPTIDVLTVDDDTARLYKNSKRAENEFGELPEVMRYCISLARKLQCPVLEYTSLGRDLLAISHHDLQRLVPSDVLLVYLERALVKVVNDMGIDINAAARSPYLGSAAQYICGLGPRKAHSLLKKIDVKGELESRSALITRGLTAAHIFMNCASYIRIRNIEDADILDDTRIHPQEYELAQKMAGDALEIDEDEMEDPDAKAAIVRRVVQEYPEKLNDLILDDYAVVLKEQYNEPKRQVLEHIKLELQNPFYEKRRRFVRPTIEEQFMMVTGETPQTLREGFIIPVKIVALRGKVANCVLDSGLEGFIYADNAADGRVMNVADVLKRGATINAKVLHIDRDKFTVDLSCRPSDTKPDSDVKLRKLPDDQYYDYEGEAKEIERRHAMERKRVKEKRMINHPLFRPFNYIQAEEYLATKNRGDIVLRPSSRGPDHIALTWKLDDGLYHHVDIVEEKVGNQIYYKIGDQRYSDLDQLSVLYVEAVHQRTEELMLHPKFRQGGPAALKSHLQSLTMANPKMSAYGFCVSDRPGYFELGFKLNAKASYANYFIKIGPKGYRFGETMYPDIPELIDGFKRFQVGQSRKSSRNPSRR